MYFLLFELKAQKFFIVTQKLKLYLLHISKKSVFDIFYAFFEELSIEIVEFIGYS